MDGHEIIHREQLGEDGSKSRAIESAADTGSGSVCHRKSAGNFRDVHPTFVLALNFKFLIVGQFCLQDLAFSSVFPYAVASKTLITLGFGYVFRCSQARFTNESDNYDSSSLEPIYFPASGT